LTSNSVRTDENPRPVTRKKGETPKGRFRYVLSKTALRVPLAWIRHTGLRPADVFLASYPRCGRTWSRFVLHEILTGRESNFETVNTTLQGVYGLSHGIPVLPNGGRLVNTHESYRRDYRRAVCLVRDVRDVVLSEFAYLRSLGYYRGDFDEFIEGFVGKGRAVNGFGPWPHHVSSWLDSPIAGTSNFLLVKYEDLRGNPEEWFERIARFLGLQLTRERIQQAVANNSLNRMRKKERDQPQVPTNDFVRTGSVQGWRGKLTDPQLELIEQYAGGVLVRLGYPLYAGSPERLGVAASAHSDHADELRVR
jgi:hypothetical protein